MAKVDEMRLIVRIARMYYEWDMRQDDIAEQLGLSQSTVSRLLKRSKEEGIIRISVATVPGVHAELEEKLIKKFGLRDAIVVDVMDEHDERLIHKELGAAAAFYLETAIRQREVIGISSWSSTLLHMVDAMHPIPRKQGIKVVQILGGVGNPAAEVHASRLTHRLADLVNGEPVFLPAPGVVGSEAALRVLLEDEYIQQTLCLFEKVTTALVGIGAVEPSKLLADSGNVFSPQELSLLRQNGAVGDVLLRFFDAHGQPVDTVLNKRVLSMSLEQLRRVNRAIGIAGGQRKYPAILGALRGGWINILVTDERTAARLAAE
jgi:DNA-binding transcriptional regulator LsrR (DeoR family)